MGRKPLKRIVTKDKKYVLGDVLGEGVPCLAAAAAAA
jgi:hypothetical protein